MEKQQSEMIAVKQSAFHKIMRKFFKLSDDINEKREVM